MLCPSFGHFPLKFPFQKVFSFHFALLFAQNIFEIKNEMDFVVFLMLLLFCCLYTCTVLYDVVCCCCCCVTLFVVVV